MVSNKKPKGLGRGLDALLAPIDRGAEAVALLAGTPMVLPLAELAPGPYQPRTRMDEGALYELAESIKSQGIMQPILVRRLERKRAPTQAQQAPPAIDTGAQYEIIAGERRFRAARLAGLAEVPVLVREVPDEAAAAMALIENIQRENLNPLEEAQGLRRLIDDFGLTHEQAAQSVGRSRSAASNLLRLLQLAEPVQTMLMAGDIDMGHARALLALDGATQITAASQVSAKKLSVREAEALVKRLGAAVEPAGERQPAGAGGPGTQARPGDVRRVEEELSDLFTAQVEVRMKARAGRGERAAQAGEIAIRFASLDELNGLIERLRGAGQASSAGEVHEVEEGARG